MFTVWFCVSGQGMMYCAKSFSTIEEAKQITRQDFGNRLWLDHRKDYWLEILDKDFRLVHTTRKIVRQIGLF